MDGTWSNSWQPASPFRFWAGSRGSKSDDKVKPDSVKAESEEPSEKDLDFGHEQEQDRKRKLDSTIDAAERKKRRRREKKRRRRAKRRGPQIVISQQSIDGQSSQTVSRVTIESSGTLPNGRTSVQIHGPGSVSISRDSHQNCLNIQIGSSQKIQFIRLS